MVRSQRMSTASTAILIALMLCYLIMTIRNSASLAAQTEIISNHPFEVVISAGDVKLYVSEMSLRTGRLEHWRPRWPKWRRCIWATRRISRR